MITKTCAVSGQSFIVTDEDLEFYEKMGVPAPTLCPPERQRRRIAYRNFRSMYRRKCDATGKMVISMYHKDHVFPVYENNYWWGDGWDPLDFGQDLDVDESFFAQYKKLAQRVPRFAIANLNCENCQYSNFAWLSKDCYLIFGCVRDEDCLYGHIVWDSKSCVDCLYVFRCEWCSECVDCVDCYDVHYSTECADCSESYFLHDCRGCRNCFGCTNLRNKQYYFLNQKLTKQEYEDKMKTLKPFKRETIEMGRDWLEKTKKEVCVFPPLFGVKNEDCVGNHLYESKNCHTAFDAKKSEDSKFLFTSYEQFNSYDISFTGGQTRFCIENLTMFGSENCRMCHFVNQSVNLDYCEFCVNCQDCFGCNGLRNKKYCILNKQYEKEAYFELRERLIESMKIRKEWGEFFPIEDSPFPYNEAIVQEYLPLSQVEVEQKGLRWRDLEPGAKYEGAKVEAPNDIDQASDDIVQQVLACRATGKSFRILKQELEFYRRVGLPLPRSCPDARHEKRMKLRNPRRLWERDCAECGGGIESSFAPDRPEKVLCEECYLKSLG